MPVAERRRSAAARSRSAARRATVAVASASGVPCSTSSSALWIALPIRASGMTSGSLIFSTYLKWNSRGQRSAVETLRGRPRGVDERARRRHAAERSRKLAPREAAGLPPMGGDPRPGMLLHLRSLQREGQRAPPRPLLGLLRALGRRAARRRRRALHHLQREAPALPEERRAVRRLEADVLQLRRPAARTSTRCRRRSRALKEAISRERRKRDRRIGKPDTRVFRYERRVGERRATRATTYRDVDDDMIIEISSTTGRRRRRLRRPDADPRARADLRPAELAG